MPQMRQEKPKVKSEIFSVPEPQFEPHLQLYPKFRAGPDSKPEAPCQSPPAAASHQRSPVASSRQLPPVAAPVVKVATQATSIPETSTKVAPVPEPAPEPVPEFVPVPEVVPEPIPRVCS